MNRRWVTFIATVTVRVYVDPDVDQLVRHKLCLCGPMLDDQLVRAFGLGEYHDPVSVVITQEQQ